ncbi:MAG: hypothetical protein V1898_02150 [Patescibacteria group bacterium]
MKKSFIGIFFIVLILLTSGAICSKSGKMPATVELNYWSPEYNEDDIKGIISGFEVQYPYVSINYRKLDYSEYDDALISAWAKGQGPDIFSVASSDVKKYYDYILPLPTAVKLTTVTEKQNFGKKEIIIAEQSQRSISPSELKNQYIDTVYKDTVFSYIDNKTTTSRIFGLPLAMDNLVLYWNRDLLNQAGISLPASDWQALVDQTTDLTKIDKDNNIIQSSIALGTSNNIEHYFDILSVLMMQFGTPMTSDSGSIIFNQENRDEKRFPAREALEFYTKFASSEWETYTWNADKLSALDSFVKGESAYYIGYHYDLATIKQLSPNLNFDIARLPQIAPQAQINYPHYWVESVAQSSKNFDISWAFVQYLTNETNSKKYIESAKKPAARRSLLGAQAEDYELAIFAEQALTAKSWYHGKNEAEAKNVFSDMIDKTLSGNFEIDKIISESANKTQLTY